MKKSSAGNHDATQSDPNALRKQTFEKMVFQSNHGDQIDHYSLRHPPPLERSPSDIATPPRDIFSSPLSKSPWSSHVASDSYAHTGLRGSLVREVGHIYSLAAAGDLLYTGSESKNIRIWKNQKEFSGFKSNSGLVKAIVIADDRVFSGHKDGKIRIWRPSPKNPTLYKRTGSMPTFKAKIKSSFKPSIKHVDPISCLTLSEDKSLLYSGSWDRNFKVWRVSDSKCLESVKAHDDAVNSIIAAFGGTVFTGSADGSIRVWKREFVGNKGKTKHNMSRTLLQQDSAVTALAADPSTAFLYGGSSDGIVIFWKMDKTSGLLSHGGVLRGHKLAVLCLATAGSLLFSGSADTNICVWRRDSGGTHTCLSVLIGHGGPVKCLAVEEEWGAASGDTRQYIVYSGSIDKSVKIWRATEAAAMMQPPPMTSTSLRHQVEDHNNSWADFSSVEMGE